MDIEQQLQVKGLNAPRLSPRIVSENIKHVEYVKHVAPSGQVLRWCVLTTVCGFAVTGRPSASVSSANDDEGIGQQVAYENALSEVWPLMGYALKERLHEAEQEEQRQAFEAENPTDHRDCHPLS